MMSSKLHLFLSLFFVIFIFPLWTKSVFAVTCQRCSIYYDYQWTSWEANDCNTPLTANTLITRSYKSSCGIAPPATRKNHCSRCSYINEQQYTWWNLEDSKNCDNNPSSTTPVTRAYRSDCQTHTPITINIAKAINPITASPFIWGVNGEFLPDLNPDTFFQTYPSVQQLGIKMLRYPGGCVADSFDWRNHISTFELSTNLKKQSIMSVDNLIEVARRLGSQILYVVNISSYDEIDACGWKSKFAGSVEEIESFVSKYGDVIKYYEIGNEQWSSWQPSVYIAKATEYAKAIKSVNPTVKTVLVGRKSNPQWDLAVKSALSSQCGNSNCFDFVNEHLYSNNTYNATLTDNAKNFIGKASFKNYAGILKSISDTTTLSRTIITEWNLKNWKPPAASYGTMEHTVFALENLLTMLDLGVYGANIHDLVHTQVPFRTFNAGLFAEDNKTLLPHAYAFRISSVMANSTILNVTNSSQTKIMDSALRDEYPTSVNANIQYVSSHGSMGKDGRLYLFLINRHHAAKYKPSLLFDQTLLANLNTNNIQVTKIGASNFNSSNLNQTESIKTLAELDNTILEPNSIYRLIIPPLVLTQESYLEKPIIAYATNSKTIAGDINRDETVNIQDVLRVIKDWKNKTIYSLWQLWSILSNWSK